MKKSCATAEFRASREPLGSYRITPLSGVWATSLEYECVLAQGAAQALFECMTKEANKFDERDDYMPSIDLRETLWPQKRDGSLGSAPGC
jgi:hypothetical protein